MSTTQVPLADAPTPDAPTMALPPGAADEMIVQAAGEQIDQLLAKADVQRTVPQGENEAAPIAPAEASAGASRDAANVDQLINQGFGAPPTGAAEPSTPEAAEPSATPAAAKVESPTSVNPANAPPAPADAPGVALPAPSPSPNADADQPADETIAHDKSANPSWLIPLEMLNRPFIWIPDSLRSVIGKAAILTLFNAAALLVYVVKFRK